jgi:DNA-binding transcriptional MerR regulator
MTEHTQREHTSGAEGGVGSSQQSTGFYRRSDVARQLHISVRTLRRYETFGLVQPVQAGGQWLYRPEDVARLRKIRRLTTDLGVNLAGAEIILRLLDRLEGRPG